MRQIEVHVQDKHVVETDFLRCTSQFLATMKRDIRERLEENYEIPYLSIPYPKSRIVILFPKDITYRTLICELNAAIAFCEASTVALANFQPTEEEDE
jgi:hypothetical protein